MDTPLEPLHSLCEPTGSPNEALQAPSPKSGKLRLAAKLLQQWFRGLLIIIYLNVALSFLVLPLFYLNTFRLWCFDESWLGLYYAASVLYYASWIMVMPIYVFFLIKALVGEFKHWWEEPGVKSSNSERHV